jgi:hypothetical protein
MAGVRLLTRAARVRLLTRAARVRLLTRAVRYVCGELGGGPSLDQSRVLRAVGRLLRVYGDPPSGAPPAAAIGAGGVSRPSEPTFALVTVKLTDVGVFGSWIVEPASV